MSYDFYDSDKSARKRCNMDITTLREDHIRSFNPTPYKVSLSEKMYNIFHSKINKVTSIGELH